MGVIAKNRTVDAIYFGGALGADTVALQASHEARIDKRPHLVVVTPDTAARQPIEARRWFKLADEVVELRHKITKDDRYAAFKLRNQYIVDISTSLVAFWNGEVKSGTGSAVRMARDVGLMVHHVKIEGRT